MYITDTAECQFVLKRARTCICKITFGEEKSLLTHLSLKHAIEKETHILNLFSSDTKAIKVAEKISSMIKTNND